MGKKYIQKSMMRVHTVVVVLLTKPIAFDVAADVAVAVIVS